MAYDWRNNCVTVDWKLRIEETVKDYIIMKMKNYITGMIYVKKKAYVTVNKVYLPY